jgi:hypothetical protein
MGISSLAAAFAPSPPVSPRLALRLRATGGRELKPRTLCSQSGARRSSSVRHLLARVH